MKVIAINGSPKPKGNTFHALELVCQELEAAGIETEIICIGNKKVSGCLACGTCIKNRDERCVTTTDPTNELIQKMKAADGILLGSPVHYSGVGGNMKSFLDRAFYVAGVNGSLFRHKVGAAIAAVRRSGGLPTFHELNNYLTYAEMFMPTSNYWNVIHGGKPGEVLEDPEGVQIMQVLGRNMAYLMQLKEQGMKTVEAPEAVRKRFTNFVRRV
jgi:multimeric flavodoxin WrbA